MTLFIEGTTYPIGKKNVNDWGLPESEVDNAITSLKSSVLKICPGEGHLCDFSEDPNGRIGKAVDAWRDGDEIKARYEVTDSVASRKINEGTWSDLKWSTYGEAASVDPEGWAHDFHSKTMTLVKNPAWKDASWAVAASENGIIGLKSISEFTIITASQNTQGGHMTAELENKIKELEKQLAASEATIKELSPKIEPLETQIEELTASKATLEKELSEKVSLIASFEKEKAGSVPMETVKTLIASAIADHDAEKAKETERETAFKAFASAREKVGLETKPEDYKSLAASDLSKLAEEFSGVKISAGAQYPATPTGTNTACTGAYTAKTGEWEL